jgi:transcription initiation factor TFIIE subunit alpha
MPKKKTKKAVTKKKASARVKKTVKKAKTSSKAKKSAKSKKDVPKAPKISAKRKQLIEDTIFAVAGENGVRIVNFLGTRENVSEFSIADRLKMDMQTVRNTLYRLHTHNAATYIRKKDRQKGWYISYWTFNDARIDELMQSMKKKQLEKLRERLEKEEANKGMFFICTKACARLDFDQATEFEFKCPECGSLLQQQENLRTIEHLKEKISELQSTI